MSFSIASHTFDVVHYDEGGDVLYLHKGDPGTSVDWDETPEGDGISFDATGELVGLTIVRPRARLESRGKLEITLPVREEHIELDAGALDAALIAA